MKLGVQVSSFCVTGGIDTLNNSDTFIVFPGFVAGV
jgi:hypothetical protein